MEQVSQQANRLLNMLVTEVETRQDLQKALKESMASNKELSDAIVRMENEAVRMRKEIIELTTKSLSADAAKREENAKALNSLNGNSPVIVHEDLKGIEHEEY